MNIRFFTLISLLGVILAIVSIPIDAYVLSGLLTISPFKGVHSFYFAWGISSALSAFIVMFPIGYFNFYSKALLFGALIGVIAVIVLIVFNLINGIYPSMGFFLEYVTLVIFSALACYWGQLTKIK